MKAIIFICSLLFFGCHTNAPPKLIEPYGFYLHCIEGECFTEDEIVTVFDNTVSVLIEVLPEKYDVATIKNKVSEYRGKVEIYLKRPHIWSVTKKKYLGFRLSSGKVAFGFIRPYRKNNVRHISIKVSLMKDRCFSYNILSHEIIHMLSWLLENDLQASHDNDMLWKDALKRVKSKNRNTICKG